MDESIEEHRISGDIRKRILMSFLEEAENLNEKIGNRPKNFKAIDLIEWSKKHLGEYFEKSPSRMHVWLGKKLGSFEKNRGIKLNVLAPRGAAKSTIGTLAYPLREALEGKEAYIWIISDTMSQAHGHLENIKTEIAENPTIAESYPESSGRGPVWRMGNIVLKNGVAIEAYGTGQKLRGRRRRQHRPSLIICDDLQNDNHIVSVDARDRSRSWFHGTLLKAGNTETNFINLATALHKEAIALELTERPGWVSKTFRAIEEWPIRTHLWEKWESIHTNIENPHHAEDAKSFYELNKPGMDEGSLVLWPEHESLYTLMLMRCESGRTAFEREKQNSPVNPEHCEWPESYFDEAIWYDELPRNIVAKTIALDPSKGVNSRRGDYSAFVMTAMDKQGIFYIDADLGRRPVPEIISCGVELYNKFSPDVFAVESNQFQDLLQDDFLEAFRNNGQFSARVFPLDNRINKLVRIRRLGPLLSHKRIRFKSASPSVKTLLDQLKSFPVGDHDDGPDALEMGIRVLEMLISDNGSEDGLPERLPVDS